MTNRSAFVVEVPTAPHEARAVVAARVADQLKLSPEKAASLVARVPGVITKPLPEERALRVVLRLQAAGLAAMHRRATPADGAPPPEAPIESAPAERAPVEPAPVEHEPASSEPAPEPAVAAAPDAAPEPEPEAVSETPSVEVVEADGAEARPPERRREAPTLVDEDVVADGGLRNPTGYDQIPSLDATRIDEPIEPDPKLTPMREAGFGAADVVLPTEGPQRPYGFVDAGPVARIERPRSDAAPPPGEPPTPREASASEAEARASGASGRVTEDADPTMVMPPDASPPSYKRVTPPPAANGSARRATPVPAPVPAPAPASRLRDAIARDRDSGERSRRPTLTDADLRLTPPPDVAYRSTRSSSDRPLTLTPPPDAVLKRSGVHEDELQSSLERRRGRFGRRLSALVTLPVALSWLLSAGFIYLLLPEELRGELWVPLAAATAIAALTGALAAGLSTSRMAGDVVRLRDDAQRIAMGDLSSPVRVRRSDELGDTAASVDRLRVSLQEALERLRKRR